MKILAPISNINELSRLHQIGATEFYCGYVPDYWTNAFNKINATEEIIHYQIGINKKDVNVANVTSFDDLNRIVELVNKNKCELFITINASFYPHFAYSILKKYFNELRSLSICNLIVNDIGLLDYLDQFYGEFKITLSCLSQITNKEAVSFYKRYNLRRIVFPRHINYQEAINIAIAHPDLEFEYFVLSGKCIYDDGYCRCHHDFGQLCTENWDSYFVSRTETSREMLVNLVEAEQRFKCWIQNTPQISCFNQPKVNMGCSLCSIYSVKEIQNICSVKIAGRGKNSYVKEEFVKITKNVIDMVDNDENIDTIRNYIKKSYISNEKICDVNTYCYIRGE